MTHYPNAQSEWWGFCGNEGHERAEVIVRERELVVSVWDSDSEGWHVWTGDEVGDGHWRMTCAQVRDSEAKLHRVPGDGVIEGSFAEPEVRGWWRVTLGKAAIDDAVR